jgi:hypothetical protein
MWLKGFTGEFRGKAPARPFFLALVWDHLMLSALRTHLLLLLAALTAGCVTNCGSAAPTPTPPTDDRLATMTAGLQQSPSLILFEGLPHHTWDRERYESELAEKKTVQLHNFAFYDAPITLDAASASRLQAILASPSTFDVPEPGVRIMHLCGGFHPDYAIRWTANGQVHEVQICFTCHEAKMYVGEQKLECDIHDGPLGQLKTILDYRRNRPASSPIRDFASPKD